MGDRGRWLDRQDCRDRQAAILRSVPGWRWSRCRNGETAASPAKVQAFNAGYEKVKGLHYEIIGNLDADISFDARLSSFSSGSFATDRPLGVAGTVFREEGYSSDTDSFEGHKHVAGGCQLFRRQCFGRDRRIYPEQSRGNRLDGSHDRTDDGLEDASHSGKSLLSPPAPGNGGTWRFRVFLFLRRERLLPRWASALGVVSGRLPDH